VDTNADERAAKFRQIEHAGWERLAAGYDTYFQGVAAQMIEPILDVAAVVAGSRVLDLCCGPGYIAARAQARGALPVGLDYSSQMLALARRSYPDISFHQADAEALPFVDATFDAVVMNLGLHHIASPEQAVAEVVRMLRPGGRFAFTVWAAPGESIVHRIILEAVKSHGCLDAAPEGPPMFRFSDPEECKRALATAGLTDVTVRTLNLVWDVPAPDGLIEAYQAGGVRLAMVLDAQTPEALQRIKETVRKASMPYEREGRQHVPIAAVLVSAGRSKDVGSAEVGRSLGVQRTKL
jgi:ubiquinone/menaquinone biosynthesis C-methylase UbiE